MSNMSLLLTTRKFYSRVFIAVLFVLLLFCRPMIPLRSNFSALMTWFGYALVIAGALGRVYASLFIGGQKNTTLVRQGPFSVVRNPLYVSSFIAVMGCALQTGMLTFPLVIAVAFAVYYPKVVKAEEAHLEQIFGEPYRAFLNEVPRWWPKLALWQQPEYVDCKPLFVYKTMRDAVIFFLPFPLIWLIHLMQKNQILWMWFHLP